MKKPSIGFKKSVLKVKMYRAMLRRDIRIVPFRKKC